MKFSNASKHRYDLPLHRSEGSHILIWVIGLMFFLASLCLWANFALSHLAQSWRHSLTGQITVEIKPELIPSADGGPAAPDRAALARHVQGALQQLDSVAGIVSARALSEAEIIALIQPWLGTAPSTELIPLPALIEVHLLPSHEINSSLLESRLKKTIPNLRIDDHSGWLQDLLGTIRLLTIAALSLTLVVLVTALAMVAASARSRMALFREEVDLLHLIGAHDSYIAGQMQRHVFFNTLKGAAWGVGCAVVFLLVLHLVWQESPFVLMPDISISPWGWALLILLPVIGSGLATVVARRTVMGLLSRVF